jgi:hypothetical protein
LLDWLAVEFMDRGWDLKHMVEVIVMSSTYRQSSNPRPAVSATSLLPVWRRKRRPKRARSRPSRRTLGRGPSA